LKEEKPEHGIKTADFLENSKSPQKAVINKAPEQ
jgi:hypothetical protein